MPEPAPHVGAQRFVPRELASVLLLQATISFGFSLYFLLPKYLTSALRADASTLGAASAVPLVAAVVTTPLTGAALDRYGRKLPVALGGLLVAVTSWWLVGVHEVNASFHALRFVQGIGFVLGFNGAAARTADVAPPARLGAAMGLLGAASLCMNALAPYIGELVTQSMGWPSLFQLAGVAGLASLVIGFVALPPHESKVAATTATPPRDERGLLIGTLANGASYATLVTFALPLAVERGAQRVSSYLFGYMLGALCVRLALGGLADRIGHRRVARLALGLMGVVSIATARLDPRLLPVFGAGLGVAHGFSYPTLAAMAARGASPARRGRALSRFAALFNTGAGAALFGAGWLAQRFGYGAGFVVVGVLTLLGTLALAEKRAAPALD